MTFVRLALVATLAAPLTVYAQPGADPTPVPAPPPPPAEPAAQPLDEAKIREIVDREMARILNERAAKEAAERAAREQAEKDAPSNAGPTDLTGASGPYDTRIAFTLTNENLLTPGWFATYATQT